ncbi:MAG: EamA family transporter [Vulcanimicrobiaceae bacterium]
MGRSARPSVAPAFAGVCSSVASTVLFKRLGTRHELVVLSSIALASAGLVLVPFAALAGPPHVSGEASRVSAYYYLTPAFGLALGALLLGEHVSVHDLAGLAATAGGIALAQRA